MNAEIRTQISSNLPNSNVPYLSIGGRIYSQYSLFFTISSCRTQHTYANRVWISAIFSTFRGMDSINELIYTSATEMTLARNCIHFLDVSGKSFPISTCTATILWRWNDLHITVMDVCCIISIQPHSEADHRREIFFSFSQQAKHKKIQTDSSIHTREALIVLAASAHQQKFSNISVWQKAV